MPCYRTPAQKEADKKYNNAKYHKKKKNGELNIKACWWGIALGDVPRDQLRKCYGIV